MPISFSKPAMTSEMLNSANECLLNDRLVNGRSVSEFEEAFSRYVGTKYAVAVNSGTAALFLSLLATGIGKGDIVVTQSATFIATANAIVHTRATPLLVDIDSGSNNLNIDQLRQVLNEYGKKIKAVIPVHLYGRMQNLDAIRDILSKENIPIIEDACQAHGAELKGRKAGSIGIAGAFSFYSSKNMTVGGDGGMITTNDQDIRDRVLSLRNQGASNGNRYKNDMIGYNFRLNSVNAAIGKVQLKYLDQWNGTRSSIAKFYTESLTGFDEIVLPRRDSEDNLSSWHIYSVLSKNRNELQKYLEKNGIETGIHYPIPVHLQNAYSDGVAITPYSMRNTLQWANQNLSLPIYGTMDLDSASYVIDNVKNFLR